jgi:hypothetical protein
MDYGMYYVVFISTKSLRLKWNLLFPSLSLYRGDFMSFSPKSQIKQTKY